MKTVILLIALLLPLSAEAGKPFVRPGKPNPIVLMGFQQVETKSQSKVSYVTRKFGSGYITRGSDKSVTTTKPFGSGTLSRSKTSLSTTQRFGAGSLTRSYIRVYNTNSSKGKQCQILMSLCVVKTTRVKHLDIKGGVGQPHSY